MNERIWELKTSSIDVVSACRNCSIYAVTDDAVSPGRGARVTMDYR